MSAARLPRDPEGAAREPWDLVVVGGGIHGAALLQEAVRRGLRAVLLERADFGGATTFDSLRIVHGGLRYLQSLDLPRYFKSVAERKWFLQTFPDLVEPLACLMPLYGEGMRRPIVMRAALALNDLLSTARNRGVPGPNRLPGGRIIGAEETRRRFPSVRREGLRGAAVWYDACSPDSQRLIVEMLCRAVAAGAAALNYLEARNLDNAGPGALAVGALDRETDREHRYVARKVINAAGPWCRQVASAFDRDQPSLLHPSIAWNVLFDRPAPSDHALAVTPRPGGHTYFLHPWKGRLFAGTGHAPWTSGMGSAMPDRDRMIAFIRDLNEAVPGLDLDEDAVVRVFAGILPAREEGAAEVSVRDVVLDHGARGGPAGLWSVSGVKLTTARALAETVLDRAFGHPAGNSQDPVAIPSRPPEEWRLDAEDCLRRWPDIEPGLRRISEAEAVLHLDDLVLRRTTLWERPEEAYELGDRLCTLFAWDADRRNCEMQRLRRALQLPDGGAGEDPDGLHSPETSRS